VAEYPSEYELEVALRDGGGARIRPIRHDDGPMLVDFFERLGPESRYFRFFRIKESLEPNEVEFFTHVDYSDRMALIAILDGKMIGLASYDKERDQSGTAEVAFAVADEHQGRGIGTQLLQHVIGVVGAVSMTHGIPDLRLTVADTNVIGQRWYERSGFRVVDGEHGTYANGQRAIRMARPLP